MIYIDIHTLEYPLTDDDIRQRYSDPARVKDRFRVVQRRTPSAFDQVTQVCREITPAMDGQGFWGQRWEVIDLSPEQIAINQSEAAQSFVKSVTAATQQRLDDFASTRNYDGILSACTYATSAIPKFQTEGQYCVNQRDATWATLYQIMGAVQAGARPMPSLEQVISELPLLDWPA